VNNFLELGISVRHAVAAGNLDLHHEDPFDRMLIAQVQLEDLTIVTHAATFVAYKVPVSGLDRPARQIERWSDLWRLHGHTRK